MPFPFQINSFQDYQEQYSASRQNPELFWGDIAEHFVWKKKWKTVLNWNFSEPHVEWFAGAKLNITENCLDRHLLTKAHQPALIWEPNDPQKKAVIFTYQQLYDEVNKMAHVLYNNGIRKGDRLCLYMPMIPELTIAILACARVGAIHNVVFGGFSAQSIADRVNDCQSKMILTTDGAYRGSKIIPMKSTVDTALEQCHCVEKVLVLSYNQTEHQMTDGRDLDWKNELEKVIATGQTYFPPAEMDAEDMLFILYTSGSTGQPKGVVHTCAGYMIWATYTFVNVFQYQPGQVHFCTADVGWITGHSYIIYGPLSAGATTVLFEGIPSYPDHSRLWQICEKHQVNILYTAPTAIRALMAAGDDYVDGYALESLKVLGSVGEPINETAWHWYNKKVGKERLPIVDTWWQTENGGIMISSLAGITPCQPGFAAFPLPGVFPELRDENGQALIGNSVSGNLVINFPWPGMLRTIYGVHKRMKQTYFSTYNQTYFTGDGCLRDENGLYRITGRVDDVLNVSGHRIGTAELENTINQNAEVVESAIVGFPHDIKGQGIFAFICLTQKPADVEQSKQDILNAVSQQIGLIAKPDEILFVNGLPKTRSGKIMRRILRKIAEGEFENIGDTSALLDPSVVEDIVTLCQKKEP